MPTPPQPAKLAIVARGETIKDAAEALGVSPGSLSMVLRGKVASWPALDQALSRHLGLPVDRLWRDDASLADAARALAHITRERQGLPATVSDSEVLGHVAAIVRGAS
jgi:transcriptional regulator with XRE-family HTH domain